MMVTAFDTHVQTPRARPAPEGAVVAGRTVATYCHLHLGTAAGSKGLGHLHLGQTLTAQPCAPGGPGQPRVVPAYLRLLKAKAALRLWTARHSQRERSAHWAPRRRLGWPRPSPASAAKLITPFGPSRVGREARARSRARGAARPAGGLTTAARD